MRILFLTTIYPPDIGGPATYVFGLREEFRRMGWKTEVITPGRIRFFSILGKALKMGRGFDVLYANGGIGASLPAIIAGKILGKKVAIKITGDYAWEQARNRGWTKDDIDDFQNKSYSLKINFLKRLRAVIARRANLVIVPSNYLKNMAVNWGVLNNKIRVIYNSCAIFNTKRLEGGDQKIIFSAGRFVLWKGFEELIGVFSELAGDFSDAKLILAGDGPLRKKMENLVLEKKLQEKIIFVGVLNKDEMRDWYSKADCFVLYSGYEGLSHVLLEALSFNLPVIASRKGGNIELIEDGKNGLLIEWGERKALKSAIKDFLSGGELIKNPGLLDPKRYSWDRLVKDTASGFRSLEKTLCLTIHTERLHDDLLWEKIKKLIIFFKKYNVQATWFSFNPTFKIYAEKGFSEVKWRDRLKYLAEHGQLIEQHTHFYKDKKGEYDLSPEHVYKRVSEDKEWLEKQGYKISGFVSGSWLLNRDVIDILNNLKFDYDCSARSSAKYYLNNQDNFILAQPQKNGNMWLVPTTGSIKESFLRRSDVVYLHDYDLQNPVIKWALKLFILLNRNKKFISVKEKYLNV